MSGKIEERIKFLKQEIHNVKTALGKEKDAESRSIRNSELKRLKAELARIIQNQHD